MNPSRRCHNQNSPSKITRKFIVRLSVLVDSTRSKTPAGDLSVVPDYRESQRRLVGTNCVISLAYHKARPDHRQCCHGFYYGTHAAEKPLRFSHRAQTLITTDMWFVRSDTMTISSIFTCFSDLDGILNEGAKSGLTILLVVVDSTRGRPMEWNLA